MAGPAVRPLQERERAMVDAMATGTSMAQIARDLGVARQQLYEWLQRPRVQEYIGQVVDDASNAIATSLLVELGTTLEVSQQALTRMLAYLEDDGLDPKETRDILASLDKHLKLVADLHRVATNRPTSIKRTEIQQRDDPAKTADRRALLDRITPKVPDIIDVNPDQEDPE